MVATLYERLGGRAVIEGIVERFYAGVATDPILRPMYPEEDLAPARERLTLFLVQVTGGPGDYGARRGHPRLRMRHLAFPIGTAARDAWLGHMLGALDGASLGPLEDAELRDYLVKTASFLMNQGLAIGGTR